MDIEYQGGNESLALCYALKKAGYQPEALKDPEAWNKKFEIPAENGTPINPEDTLEVMDEKNKGWFWQKHPIYGWYPDPGRRALCDEIRKLIGNDAFDAKYGVDDKDNNKFVHQTNTHEGWIAEWIKTKAETSTTPNDIPDTVAPGTGSSEESLSPEV